MAARIPTMTTTTMSSIMLKPPSFLILRVRLLSISGIPPVMGLRTIGDGLDDLPPGVVLENGPGLLGGFACHRRAFAAVLRSPLPGLPCPLELPPGLSPLPGGDRQGGLEKTSYRPCRMASPR